MAQPAPIRPPLLVGYPRREPEEPQLRFEMQLLTQHPDGVRRRSATFMTSLVVHAVLIALVVVIPILTYNALPAPSEATRAFFVAPPEAAPPPPPPPPPAGVRSLAKTPAAPTPPPTDASFVSPAEVPDVIKPDQGLDLGVEGGVPGGVEGGVPGGVLGGIVGGMPPPAPPPSKVVRVGGQIKAPKSIKIVPPVYPDLAAQARLAAIVIAEAEVDTRGRVRAVRILRGAPLFDDAAIEAVKQWLYQPLLLNGVPTEFILTVTVKFNLNLPQK